MKTFTIALTEGNPPAGLDAAKLIDGCALIQGVRGSGKSFTARVIIEQTMNRGLQTIVLDPEGEFSTLRECCDCLVVGGRDGDLPIDVKHAKLLARRIAETSVSAVVDLSMMKLDDRPDFVRDFLNTFNALPRDLERPRLIVLDEAHKFVPESSKGSASSTDAVITTQSQGRKRGIGMLLLTQRLSKIRKDAAAECANYLIGCTSAIDLGSAQDLLGCTKEHREQLRKLGKGYFVAEGPAFVELDGVILLKIRKAKSTHPESGYRDRVSTPPPKAAIKKLLKEFEGLPTQAKEEAQDLASAKAQIRDLEKQLKQRGAGQPDPEILKDLREEVRLLRERCNRLDSKLRRAGKLIQGTAKALSDYAQADAAVADDPVSVSPKERKMITTLRQANRPPMPPEHARNGVRVSNGSPPQGGAFRRMLIALAQHEVLPRNRLAMIAGISPTSGTFSTYLSSGRTQGYWIAIEGKKFKITPEGIGEAGAFEPLPTGQELVEYWCASGTLVGKTIDMIRVIVDAGEEGISKADLAEAVGLSASSGTFSTYLSKMRTLGLISRGAPFVAAEDLRD